MSKRRQPRESPIPSPPTPTSEQIREAQSIWGSIPSLPSDSSLTPSPPTPTSEQIREAQSIDWDSIPSVPSDSDSSVTPMLSPNLQELPDRLPMARDPRVLLCVFSHGLCEIRQNEDRTLKLPLYTVPPNMEITRYSLPIGTFGYFEKTESDMLYELVRDNANEIMDGDISKLKKHIKRHMTYMSNDPTYNFGLVTNQNFRQKSIADYRDALNTGDESEIAKAKAELVEDQMYFSEIKDFIKGFSKFYIPKRFSANDQIMDKTYSVSLQPGELKRRKYIQTISIIAITADGHELTMLPGLQNGEEVLADNLSSILNILYRSGYTDITIMDFSCSGASDEKLDRRVRKSKKRLSRYGGRHRKRNTVRRRRS